MSRQAVALIGRATTQGPESGHTRREALTHATSRARHRPSPALQRDGVLTPRRLAIKRCLRATLGGAVVGRGVVKQY
ncbi:hypothetical protein CHO01_36650 [Cellulomonas hominis]|uniref:Uncharacterized protein n=1 Tax=Cellulomonas hominis TaxID=156981 RepID=A0A511FH01_9CELL|nr:hypothetical protein CHO01_36650 [Cellulomonas hominis]